MLMFLQCSVAALNFVMTPFWLPLWSHQRSDIVNFAAVGIFASSGLALWLGFEAGLRYYSLVLSNFVGGHYVHRHYGVRDAEARFPSFK